MKSKERRRFARLPKETTIVYHELEFPLTKKKTRASKMKNISIGGLLFEAPQKFDLGAILKLEISLPGFEKYRKGEDASTSIENRAISVIAEVVRVEEIERGRRYAIGAKFVNIFEEDLRGLNDYLENERKKDYLDEENE